MRLEQLEYLISVANNHSMHTASNLLHVSQQNISKAIKQLEDELGTKIFDRTNRGVKLTDDGQKIYAYASSIINQIKDMKKEFCPASPDSTFSGSLTLYHANGLTFLIDSPFKLFCGQYPHISPILIERDSVALFNELPELLPEIALLQSTRQQLLEQPFLQEHYHLYLIAEEPLQVYMSPTAKYANAKSISLKTLSTLPLCLNTDSPNKLPIYAHILSSLHIPLNIKFITNTNSALINYIQNDMAYGLLTASTAKTLPQHITPRIVPLREKILVASAFLTRREDALSPPARAFIDVFKTTYRDSLQQLF